MLGSSQCACIGHARACTQYQDITESASQEAIHDAYTTTNEEIASRLDAAMDAGSCAVTAVVTRVGRQPYLFCANAGDCRAVLYTQSNGTKRCALGAGWHQHLWVLGMGGLCFTRMAILDLDAWVWVA